MKNTSDVKVVYSLACLNMQREAAAKDPEWGKFISPQLATHLYPSDSRAYFMEVDFTPYMNRDPLFDSIVNKTQQEFAAYHRSSAKYYFDCFNLLKF